MTLLDRFRRRPRWEDPDPEVRAEAVRELGAGEQELFGSLASSDPDSRVRRAAAKRLVGLSALTACLTDSDLGVREEANQVLLAFAQGEDAGLAGPALAALTDSKLLVTLARSAPLPEVRRGAFERLSDPRSLASVAKLAAEPQLRLEALRRVADAELLLDIACKSEHKDVVVAAVERIDDAEALRAVVGRARNKAAARRASGKLEALRSSAPAVAPDVVEAPAPAPVPPDRVAAMAAPDPVPLTVAAEPPIEEIPAALPSDETAAPEAPDSVAVAAEPAAEEAAPAPALESAAPPAGDVPAPEAPSTARDATADAEERRKKAEQHRAAVARLEALCERLEALTKAPALVLKDAEAGMRDSRVAQADLDHAHPKLKQRLKAARTALFAKTQELREADEWSRWGNATVQEELCVRMEGLLAREDFERVSRELRECDERWASARYAPKDQAESLRGRYQTARAQVKSRLDGYFGKKLAVESENLKAKLELCTKAEALSTSTEWLKAAEELKALQARWKEVGPVPHRKSEAVWKRFRGACDAFFTRRDQDLRQRKDQWSTNLAAKEALCQKAAALAESAEWEATAAEIRKLQAEWKTIGPVQRKKSEEIWQRFRGACDHFFERYKNRDQVELEGKRLEREAVCAELEALLPAEADAAAAEGLAETVQALQARARQSPLSGDSEARLNQRFVEARNRLVARYPGAFQGTDLDPVANRARKEKLCARVEALLSAIQSEDAPLTGEALARRLKEALAANTMGGHVEVEARRRAQFEEVESAQAAWKRLGPIPGEAGVALEERFRRAVSQLLDRSRSGSRRRPTSGATA
jgi:hypothetical protein